MFSLFIILGGMSRHQQHSQLIKNFNHDRDHRDIPTATTRPTVRTATTTRPTTGTATTTSTHGNPKSGARDVSGAQMKRLASFGP